jgi:hypothetical protein
VLGSISVEGVKQEDTLFDSATVTITRAVPLQTTSTAHRFTRRHCTFSIYMSAQSQTTFSFHLPRLKRIALHTASIENAMVIAQNTPLGPILKW